jgi:O-antigen/teichoic acid export membrane protein
MNFFFLNIVSVGFLRAIAALSGLSLFWLITIHLTQKDAGQAFFYITAVTIFAGLSTMGYQTTLLRFLGFLSGEGEQKKINYFLSLAIKKTLICGLCLNFFILILFELFSADIAFQITFFQRLFYFITTLFMALILLYVSALQGLGKSKIAAVFQALTINVLTILILLVYASFDIKINLNLVLSIYLISILLTCFFSYKVWTKFNDKGIEEKVKAYEFNQSAKKVWVSMIMTVSIQWFSFFYSGFYLNSESLALFSVSQKIAVSISFILTAINFVVAPKFAQWFSRNDFQNLRLEIQRSNLLIWLIASPLAIGVLIFSNQLMSFFGQSYVQGSDVLIILAFGQFINAITGSVAYILNMTGNESDIRNIIIFCGFTAITMSLILVPLYGIIGAAFSCAIPMVLQNLLAVLIANKRLGFNVMKIFNFSHNVKE